MSRLTLLWHLRALRDGPPESDENPGNEHSWHDPRLARDALRADDPVAFLNRKRLDPIVETQQRIDAADLLTRHLWPDDAGVQNRTIAQTGYAEDDDGTLITLYSVDAETRMREGYHHGGLWWPHVPSASPLTCPDCGHRDDFWDFARVDAGETDEPDLRCPHCQWVPPTVA